MDIQEVRSVFINELPAIMRNNDKIRQTIVDIAKKRFADRDESDRRFDRIMDELVAQRKENKNFGINIGLKIKKAGKNIIKNTRKFWLKSLLSLKNMIAPLVLWRVLGN